MSRSRHSGVAADRCCPVLAAAPSSCAGTSPLAGTAFSETPVQPYLRTALPANSPACEQPWQHRGVDRGFSSACLAHTFRLSLGHLRGKVEAPHRRPFPSKEVRPRRHCRSRRHRRWARRYRSCFPHPRRCGLDILGPFCLHPLYIRSHRPWRPHRLSAALSIAPLRPDGCDAKRLNA